MPALADAELYKSKNTSWNGLNRSEEDRVKAQPKIVREAEDEIPLELDLCILSNKMHPNGLVVVTIG